MNYIPRKDADFNLWQQALVANLIPNANRFGIATTVITALQKLKADWEGKFAVVSTPASRTASGVEAKNDARTVYERALREFIKEYLAYNSKVTDSERKSMGITVPKKSRTPNPVPDSAPMARIDASNRLQHIIHFYGEDAAGKRAKPAGVQGCEIWSKTGGEAPVNEADLTFVGMDTKTPYLINYQGNEAGKTVYYWLRWVNTRGEAGPWSQPVSSMILG